MGDGRASVDACARRLHVQQPFNVGKDYRLFAW
jgi:hypothetical protein